MDWKERWKSIEETVIKGLVAACMGAIGTLIFFYFNTRSVQAAHSEHFVKVDARLDTHETKINSISVGPEVNTKQIEDLKDAMNKMWQEMRDNQANTNLQLNGIRDNQMELSRLLRK